MWRMQQTRRGADRERGSASSDGASISRIWRQLLLLNYCGDWKRPKYIKQVACRDVETGFG
jgi:hypothetical protein